MVDWDELYYMNLLIYPEMLGQKCSFYIPIQYCYYHKKWELTWESLFIYYTLKRVMNKIIAFHTPIHMIQLFLYLIMFIL